MGTLYKISSRILIFASLWTGIFTIKYACPEPFRESSPLQLRFQTHPFQSLNIPSSVTTEGTTPKYITQIFKPLCYHSLVFKRSFIPKSFLAACSTVERALNTQVFKILWHSPKDMEQTVPPTAQPLKVGATLTPMLQYKRNTSIDLCLDVGTSE
jgi:hypothetical protein